MNTWLDNKERSFWLRPTVLLLWLGGFFMSCQAAQPDGIRVIPFPPEPGANPRASVDDLIVWPVLAPPGLLDDAMLNTMQNAIYRGMIDHRYSALSPGMVKGLSKRLGLSEAAAKKAGKEVEADGVLLISLSTWDEAGLYTLGRIRAEGEIKLLGPDGKLIWGGSIHCRSKLVASKGRRMSLAEKRREAVRSFARQLVKQIPRH